MEASVIFSKLFLKNSKNEITNQLIDTSVIPIFFSYLTDPKTPEHSIIHLLTLLKEKLKSCRLLFSFFSENNNRSIYLYLIDLFLKENISTSLQTTILSFIQDLIGSIQLSKQILDYIYQKFAYLYNNPSNLSSSKINTLLILLNSLLGNTDNSEKPNNFFCLNGKSGIEINLSKSQPINPRYPISIVLNFKICLPDNNQSVLLEQGNLANLIEIQFTNGKQFSVDLKYPMFIIVSSLRKDPIKCPPFEEWLALVLNIHYRENRFLFQLFLNGENTSMNYEIPNFTLEENIMLESITLFKGFFGEVTSMFLINSKYSNDYKKLTILKSSYLQQFKNLKEGLWKKSNIDSFTNMLFNLDSDDDIQQLPKRSIYTKRKDEPPRKLAEDVRFMFTPFSYSGSNINDVFGHCNAIYGDDIKIHRFKSLQKKLSIIGGDISNLLPIAEMLFLNQNILTEDILYNYLNVINTILNDRKENIRNAKNTKFFETLSLFIEKFPSKLFTQKILEALASIGRVVFKETEEMLASVYFENIFLNEKILSKFSQELQIKFWNTIALFCQSDKSQIETFVNMRKICLILQSYDEKKYSQMCCDEHYQQFDSNIVGKIEIMEPSMKRKLSDLKGIISLIIDSQLAEHAIILFKLLTLDVSPCLAKFIINIFKGVFINTTDKEWVKSLHKVMFTEKCDVILANTFKYGLLDIRLDIIDLLQEMHKFSLEHRELITANNMDKLFNMIKTCLVPQSNFYFQDRTFCCKPNDIKELAIHCVQKIKKEKNEYSCKIFNGNCIIFKKEKFQEYINILYQKILIWSMQKEKDEKKKENKFDEIKLEQKILSHYNVLMIALRLTDLLNDSFYYKKCIDYLHKLMEHKTNCFTILKEKLIIFWIIQLAYDNFHEHNTYSFNIYGVAFPVIIKIFCGSFELIAQSQQSRQNQQMKLQMHEVELLFLWADSIRNKENESKIYEFMKTIFKGIIDKYNKITKINFKIDKTDKQSLTEFHIDFYMKNYLVIVTLIYYFNFYFKFDPDIIENNSPYLNENVYTMKLSEELLNSISLDMKVSKKIDTMWNDYDFFDDLISKVQWIWSKENSFKGTNLGTHVFLKYGKILKHLILDKSKKNLYLDELKLLCYGESDNEIEKIVPLVRIIPITLAIIIHTIRKHSYDNPHVKYWIKQMRHFIRFIILASTNAISINQQDSFQYQCLDAIVFCICFFYSELQNKENIGYEYIEKSLYYTLTFCFYIVHTQYEYIENHNSILKKLSKPSRNDLTNCAVFKLFSEFIVDKQGQPLITYQIIHNTISSQYKGLFKMILDNTEWKNAFFENQTLQARMNMNYLASCNYQAIVFGRYDFIKKIESDINDNYQREIVSLVQIYDNELTQYSNNSFYIVRNKKMSYKKIKKALFSWNGTWSDRNLFYNEISKLKVRILNHYSKFFSRPCLIPILDLDYYIPDFTKFNVSTLFRDTHSQFKLGLDIDAILKSQTSIQNENSSNNNNIDKSNFIRQIYKQSNPELAYFYLKINNKMDLGKDAEIIRTLTMKNNSKTLNTGNQPKQYLCCLVKQSHHIKGVLSIEDNNIIFQVFLNQKAGKSLSGVDIGFKQTDEDYDSERKTCFGSYFVWHHKDLDKNALEIEFKQIYLFFRKRYYFKNSAIEIFTKSNKSYYFNFKEESNREKVITEILSRIKDHSILIDDLRDPKTSFDNVVGYQIQTANKKIAKKQRLSKIISSWCNWEISNYELIMWLNFFANRSFLDLTQYPVMPWVLEDYTDPLQKPNEDGINDYKYRDLLLPMGMLTVFPESEVRKELFVDLYDTMKSEQTEQDDSQMTPYVYGSHYSNPVYVANYLTRLFPFSHIAIELQGANFDNPDRLFCSIQTSFFNSATQKTDLRELIPEFYYLPEMFRNINNLNMGIKENQELVHNVLTPCNDEPYEFVLTLRKVLESTQISSNIQKWIDLIFGFKQRGKEADLAYNVFTEKSYEDLVDVKKETDKACLYRLVEFGLTPEQVTAKEFPARYKKENVKKLKEITDSEASIQMWKCQSKFDKKGDGCYVIKAEVTDNERISLFYNNNYFTQIKVSYSFLDKDYKAEPVKSNYQLKNKLLYKIDEFYQGGVSKESIVTFIGNGKYVVLGGFFDGKCVILSIDNALPIEINHPLDNNTITAIEVDKDEEFLICGNSIGNMFIYKILGNEGMLYKELYDFQGKIVSIDINNELNLWTACSNDGYVNVYTMPTCKLIRSIQLPNKSIPSFIFLSSCPLPCFVVICGKEMFVYTINGKLHVTQQMSNEIVSPIIMRDLHFSEYLTYLIDDMVYIRSFPSLTLEVTIPVSDNISHLCISEDMQILYGVSLDGNEITVIRDQKELKTVDENIENMNMSTIQ